MAIKVARGQITIIDQNDAVSLQAFIGSNQPLTQVYNKDTNTYAPSWTASPYLVLTPALYVSGKGGTDQITAVGNAAALTPGIKSGSTKWYKNGTLITNGQDSCTIGAASAKYALTIKANHLTIAAPQAVTPSKQSTSTPTVWRSHSAPRYSLPSTSMRGYDRRRVLCPGWYRLQE